MKGKKFLLISVLEMEISTQEFEDENDAFIQMSKEFVAALDGEISEDDVIEACVKSEDNAVIEEDYYYALYDDWAWVEDGFNHNNYSWKIVEVSCESI